MMEKTLVVIGDSWTWGSEVTDPESGSNSDSDPQNVAFRLTNVWSYYLNEKLQFKNYVNLGVPSCSNDSIIRNLTWWLAETGRLTKDNNDDVFVVVGLTSPDRKDFYAMDDRAMVNRWLTLHPARYYTHFSEEATTFAETYRTYFSNQEESTFRYLNTILYLQMLLEKCGIKYLMFQAFYDQGNLSINNWKDELFLNKIFEKKADDRDLNNINDLYFTLGNNLSPNYQKLWNMIDSIKFVNRDIEPRSFCNYIIQQNNHKKYFKSHHPTEHGHKLWADYLYDYIVKHNILG